VARAPLPALAPPGVFAGIIAERTAIVSEPATEADASLCGSRPNCAQLAWHSLPVLCEPDIEERPNEAELRFAQSPGAGLFEV
jgi:hypothetical protein